jgi:hypothetical protein
MASTIKQELLDVRDAVLRPRDPNETIEDRVILVTSQGFELIGAYCETIDEDDDRDVALRQLKLDISSVVREGIDLAFADKPWLGGLAQGLVTPVTEGIILGIEKYGTQVDDFVREVVLPHLEKYRDLLITTCTALEDKHAGG